MQVYRIRRSAAAGLTLFGVPVILMTALAVVQLPRLSWIDLAPVLVFAVWYVRARRQTLTVDDDGIVVQRPGYRLIASWADITGVRRRPGMVSKVDELVLSDSRTEAVDERGKPGRVPKNLAPDGPTLRHIRVSHFDGDWRTGPIGEHLRRLGVL